MQHTHKHKHTHTHTHTHTHRPTRFTMPGKNVYASLQDVCVAL